MAYLYGDSTPFPLDENFLETARDVIDTAVGLVLADDAVQRARDRSEETRRDAVREQAKLEKIAQGVVHALEGPMQDPESPGSAKVAGRVLVAARGVLEEARGESAVRRDAALRELEAQLVREKQLVPQLLEGLLARRQLPQTVWKLWWRAVGAERAEAQVTGRAPCGLESTLALDIPAAHLWVRGVRVKALAKDLVVHVPREGGLLRRDGFQTLRLDGWMIAEVTVSPERVMLVLRRSLDGPSEGLELTVRDKHGPAPSLRRMLKGGGATGPVVQVVGDDAQDVERLWRRVADTMRDLERRRGHLIGATLEGKPLSSLDRPARLAMLLLDAVAPYTCELKRRSHAPGELILKRDLGGGRREELFVPVRELLKRVMGLPPARRALFDLLGLGTGDGGGEALERALDAALADDEESASAVRPVDAELLARELDALEREAAPVARAGGPGSGGVAVVVAAKPRPSTPPLPLAPRRATPPPPPPASAPRKSSARPIVAAPIEDEDEATRDAGAPRPALAAAAVIESEDNTDVEGRLRGLPN